MPPAEPPRPFQVEIPVRFRDLDPIGHVNNAVYLSYLEIARTEWWLELHDTRSWRALDFVVARVEIDFVSAAEHGETIRAEVGLARIGTRSFALDYRLVATGNERLVARARTVQVMIDAASGGSRPIEPELAERMRAFAGVAGVEPDEPAGPGPA